MPIEFFCPGCGNLMRTPDNTAGRKGKCPTCGIKIQIPTHSVAAPAETQDTPSETPGPARGDRSIRFPCGHCGQTLNVPAGNAGKRGKCPACGAVMSIPQAAPAAAEAPAPESSSRWKGTPKAAPRPAAAAGPIRFQCPGCSRVVQINRSAAGKRGKCPACQQVFEIPKTSSGSLTPPTPVPMATRPAQPHAAQASLPASRPQAPAARPSSAADDLFADLPSSGTGGFVGLPSTPYQSPMAPQLSRRSGARAGQLAFGDVFETTWRLYRENLAVCVLAMLSLIGLGIVLAAAGAALLLGVTFLLAQIEATPQVALWTLLGVRLVFTVVDALVRCWLQAGITRFTSRIARGKDGDVANVFNAGEYTLLLFVYAILTLLLTLPLFIIAVAVMGGLAVLGVPPWAPGILMVLLFLFVVSLIVLGPFYIVDGRCSPLDAIARSVKQTAPNLLIFIALNVTMFMIVGLLIVMTLGFGLFFFPILIPLMHAVVYVRLSGKRDD